MDDISKWLQGNPAISTELLLTIRSNIREVSDEALRSGLDVLRVKVSPGKPPDLVSRHPRNLLINWRQLLFQVLPSAVSGAVAAETEPIAGALGCLSAVYQLTKIVDIALSDDHARVVLALWSNHEKTNPVPPELLAAALPNLEPERLTALLDDLVRLRALEIKDSGAVLKKERIVLLKSA